MQNFPHNGSLSLSVTVFDFSYFRIGPLVWYHNGRVISSEKHGRLTIDGRGTRLRILKVEKSDAGTYQVKVNSTSFNFFNNSASCDELMLPMLELTAGHAPVTFIVQEQGPLTYDPSNIFSNLYALGNTSKLPLHTTIDHPPGFVYHLHSVYWYKHARRIFQVFDYPEDLTHTLVLDTKFLVRDVFGEYIGTIWITFNDFDPNFKSLCSGYFDYIRDVYLIFPLAVSYWRVKLYSKYALLVCHS